MRSSHARIRAAARKVMFCAWNRFITETLDREKKIAIAPGAARPNVVTRGVPLNHLVGREFQVGAVRLRGTRLC